MIGMIVGLVVVECEKSCCLVSCLPSVVLCGFFRTIILPKPFLILQRERKEVANMYVKP
jgi:hypothetical protein